MDINNYTVEYYVRLTLEQGRALEEEAVRRSMRTRELIEAIVREFLDDRLKRSKSD